MTPEKIIELVKETKEQLGKCKEYGRESQHLLHEFTRFANTIYSLLEENTSVWLYESKPPMDLGTLEVTLHDGTVDFDTFTNGKWEKYSEDQIKAFKFWEHSRPATDKEKEEQDEFDKSGVSAVWYNKLGDTIEFSISRESSYAQWINHCITLYRTMENKDKNKKDKIIGFQLTNVRSILDSMNLMGI